MGDSYKTLARYFQSDPIGYCKVFLGVTLTPEQENILRALLVPPHKVLVRAGHNVGKTFLAACASCWFYDCFDPSVTLITAPTERQVKNIIFKEIRTLRAGLGGWKGPQACHIQDSPKHFMYGFCAKDDTRFQGNHENVVAVIFDEATGIERCMWEAGETMWHFFLGIYNPTDATSYVYEAERSGNYHVLELSALNHPNIIAATRGIAPPYPTAITYEKLGEMIKMWSEPIEDQVLATDIEWPPGSNTFYRPGPVAEARLLGRWPINSSNAVWTDQMWERVTRADFDEAINVPIVLAADPARFGEDDTTIACRRGRKLIHLEAHNGWTTTQTAFRLRQLAEEYARKWTPVNPKHIPILIDDVGVGGGVRDQGGDFNFRGVNVNSRANSPYLYDKRRSELWFDVAEAANKGFITFKYMPNDLKERLRGDLLGPFYSLDYSGRRVVESRKDMKERTKRSPDLADAVNLCFSQYDMSKIDFSPPKTVKRHNFVS